MRIILLSGKPNTGKTTTLNLLYDEITQKGAKNIVEKRQQVGSEERDFKCVVAYNKKEIAIFSMGDLFNVFVEAIIEYSKCDVLVLAYSEKFIKKLDKFIENPKYNHCVIRKTESNEKDCGTILSKLKK